MNINISINSDLLLLQELSSYARPENLEHNKLLSLKNKLKSERQNRSWEKRIDCLLIAQINCCSACRKGYRIQRL